MCDYILHYPLYSLFPLFPMVWLENVVCILNISRVYSMVGESTGGSLFRYSGKGKVHGGYIVANISGEGVI